METELDLHCCPGPHQFQRLRHTKTENAKRLLFSPMTTKSEPKPLPHDTGPQHRPDPRALAYGLTPGPSVNLNRSSATDIIDNKYGIQVHALRY